MMRAAPVSKALVISAAAIRFRAFERHGKGFFHLSAPFRVLFTLRIADVEHKQAQVERTRGR